MFRKLLLATALVVAALAMPALTPGRASAQVIVRGPRVGISTPYYGGTYYGGGANYGSGYYGYRPYSAIYPAYGYANQGVIVNGGSAYRPSYTGYPVYGYSNQAVIRNGFSGSRYYGPYWR